MAGRINEPPAPGALVAKGATLDRALVQLGLPAGEQARLKAALAGL